jgi:hypothetical protein
MSGNKYCRQKVYGSINFKFFTIFPTTYVRISLQTVSEVSTIFYVLVVAGTWYISYPSGNK